jgi:DNA processing protein
VVSGLAVGVDTEALKTAHEARGRTIAVIGTPLDKAYPAGKELLYRENLLISQFPPGKRLIPAIFPKEIS